MYIKKGKDFQKRYLLSLLSDDESTKVLKTILKSPLGLTQKIVQLLFENNFEKIKDNLDTIKQFVAGITRSEQVGKSYTVGKFYPYLFSFHQFIHSSYRARQGKTLEELFKRVMREADTRIYIADKEKEKRGIMSEIFTEYDSRLDIDIVAKKGKGKVLVLQLRSRDDTGGTTAKSSLVEVLRQIMGLNVTKGTDLFYLIGIWDAIKGNQKRITISKIYDSLENFFQKKISKEHFSNKIEKGIALSKGIILKLAYGTEDIIQDISAWMGKDTKFDYRSMKKAIKLLENSDDLWLSYVIASLELENIKLKGINNIEYLNQLLKGRKINISYFNSPNEYLKIANQLTLDIIPVWENDSLPVSSISEKAHYIRDLILMRFIYEIS